MTTATLPTTALHAAAQPRPLTRQRSDDFAALPAALRSEWIKVRSLRFTPGLLAAVVVNARAEKRGVKLILPEARLLAGAAK